MTLQSLIDQNKEAFIGQFGRTPEIIAQAPGRINVLANIPIIALDFLCQQLSTDGQRLVPEND